jgi:2-polyprenyl-3-methyl-5-hydroxy-6-metoxy-1,4-benzoquinol methylase
LIDPVAPDVDSATADYAGRFAGPVGEYLLEVQTKIVLELLRPFPAARILDVGGGHAQLAPPLVAAGFQVTVVGSEVSCRGRLDELLPPDSFRFQASSLSRLPFADGSFDVVLAFRLLAHVQAWREFVKELCRVARHAVLVDYADVLSVNALSRVLFGLKRSVEGNTRPYRCLRTAEVAREFRKEGFPTHTARGQFCFPMALHRAMRCAGLSRRIERVARYFGLTAVCGSPVILMATNGASDLSSSDG